MKDNTYPIKNSFPRNVYIILSCIRPHIMSIKKGIDIEVTYRHHIRSINSMRYLTICSGRIKIPIVWPIHTCSEGIKFVETYAKDDIFNVGGPKAKKLISY